MAGFRAGVDSLSDKVTLEFAHPLARMHRRAQKAESAIRAVERRAEGMCRDAGRRVTEQHREKLGREVDEADYGAVRDALVEEGVLAKGQGRGGSVRLAAAGADDEPDEGDPAPALVLQSPEPKEPGAKKAAKKPAPAKPAAARGSTSGDEAQVSAADAKRLEKLGFIWSEEDDGAWISFKFGSA